MAASYQEMFNNSNMYILFLQYLKGNMKSNTSRI